MIGSAGVAWLLYSRLIAHIGPANAIAVTFLIPAFAVAWGWLFLGEGTGLATGRLAAPRRLGRWKSL